MKFRNHHAGCCGFNPTHPDGSEWAHVLSLHDGSTVHADTAAEAVSELIDGYPDLDADARLAARIRLAESLAGQHQELRITRAVDAGLLDPADPDQAALLDIMRADKKLSLFLETEDAPGVQAAWLPLPELVLVSTSYAPHTDTPPLAGHVVWLDPTGDDALLRSLGEAGVFNYWAAQRP